MRLAYQPFLLAAVLALSACSNKGQSPEQLRVQAFAEVKAEIGEIVQDPGRVEELNVLVDRMSAAYSETYDNMREGKARLRELNSDYDVSREALDAELLKMRQITVNDYKEIIEIRSDLAELLTEDEWDRLQKVRSKALDAGIDSLQVI